MQIYLVGGAVRDALLGLPVQDRDWVVVGARPEDLTARGFLPVGRDFPVFLHPRTHEEYALARTERKTAPGYRGFTVHAAPDVTLEQDLARRDLTVNSIAYSPQGASLDSSMEPYVLPNELEPERLVDPFSGLFDLKNKVLRHTTVAFREDPVRILRVARFAARFPDFSVAAETRELMRQMVTQGEADSLVPERVWQELSRGLMAARPSQMMGLLHDCGALDRVLPKRHHGATDAFNELDTLALAGASLPVRFARMMAQFEPDVTWLKRVPADCRNLAELLQRESLALNHSDTLGAEELVALLGRCDAWRRHARFAELLQTAECSKTTTLRLLGALAASRLDNLDLTARNNQPFRANGQFTPEAVHRARLDAIAAFLSLQQPSAKGTQVNTVSNAASAHAPLTNH